MTAENNLDEKVKEFYEWTDQKDTESQLKAVQFPLPRMLFLDDRTKRIEAARKKYVQQYDVTYVHNAKECLRYLCRQEFDIVSLDHDLDGDDFQNPDDVTSGMEVVRYIVKCGGFPSSQIVKPEVWIHSSNLFAANLMINELMKVGIFAYFRRFEYGDEKKACECKKTEPIKLPEDKWEYHGYGMCISCDTTHPLKLNEHSQCYVCYIRELISASGMTVTDYWAMRKCKQ